MLVTTPLASPVSGRRLAFMVFPTPVPKDGAPAFPSENFLMPKSHWTDANVTTLKAMLATRKDIPTIAAKLKRTQGAIRQKMCALHLSASDRRVNRKHKTPKQSPAGRKGRAPRRKVA